MLSKIIRDSSRLLTRRGTVSRFFSAANNEKGQGSKGAPKAPKAPQQAQPVQRQPERQTEAPAPRTQAATASSNVPDDWKVGPSVRRGSEKVKLEDVAYLGYRKLPTHLPHNNPKDPRYIASERDELRDAYVVEGHNYIVDRFKSDLRLQQVVNDILEKIDRPYLKGEPGNDRNINGGVKNYFPGGDVGFPTQEDPDNAFLEANFRNRDRWVSNSPFIPKFARMAHHDVDWQKELESRPVNPNYNHDKGYKYDVLVPQSEKYPYVADRMGHPEILGTPIERLMRLEGEIFHPTYLDQPFIQMPSASPSANLNFEEGEVIYENTRVLEWSKFWHYSGLAGYLFGVYFVPYSLIYKTHLALPSAFDNLFSEYHGVTPFFFDNNGLHIPLWALFGMYTAYMYSAFSHRLLKDYVVRLQYNKDKELVFATVVTPWGGTEEEAFEVAHLEVMPPSVRSGISDYSSQDNDGLWDIHCLSSQRSLVVYWDDKFWNQNVKKEFMNRVMNFWTPDLAKPTSRAERYSRESAEPRIPIGGPQAKRIEA